MYSHDFLESLSFNPFSRYCAAKKLLQLALHGKYLSYAEVNFLGVWLTIFKFDDVKENKEVEALFESLVNFQFTLKFSIYSLNLNGLYNATDAFGPISLEKRKLDAKFLDDQYQEWQLIVEKLNHDDIGLKNISSETRKIRKEIKKRSILKGEGANHQRYIDKTIILNSKYIYLKVLRYYEELGSPGELITIGTQDIVIDSLFYCHVLLQHFAETHKFNRPGKTYFTEIVEYDNLPAFVIRILTMYKIKVPEVKYRYDRLYFSWIQQDYAIWMIHPPGYFYPEINKNYKLVKTLYPVKIGRDVETIAGLNRLVVHQYLTFYI